jgi:hypothetical protein
MSRLKWPVILVLRRWRQEDRELEANLDYIARTHLKKEREREKEKG